VETSDGRDFLLYHSYRRRRDTFNVGRESVLDEIEWGADGWPIVNEGRGPSSVAPAPLGVAGRDAGAEFFDDFNAARLGPEWQWPLVLSQTFSTGRVLDLAPRAGAQSDPQRDEYADAVVARRTTSGDYVATALVETRGMGASARAGLSAYAWRGWAVGIAAGGGRVTVWRREGDNMRRNLRVMAETEAPKSDALYLRMTAEGGERYSFAFSADGRDWTAAGGAVEAAYIEGARVALTASGGAARFDWVKIVTSGE